MLKRFGKLNREWSAGYTLSMLYQVSGLTEQELCLLIDHKPGDLAALDGGMVPFHIDGYLQDAIHLERPATRRVMSYGMGMYLLGGEKKLLDYLGDQFEPRTHLITEYASMRIEELSGYQFTSDVVLSSVPADQAWRLALRQKRLFAAG